MFFIGRASAPTFHRNPVAYLSEMNYEDMKSNFLADNARFIESFGSNGRSKLRVLAIVSALAGTIMMVIEMIIRPWTIGWDVLCILAVCPRQSQEFRSKLLTEDKDGLFLCLVASRHCSHQREKVKTDQGGCLLEHGPGFLCLCHFPDHLDRQWTSLDWS